LNSLSTERIPIVISETRVQDKKHKVHRAKKNDICHFIQTTTQFSFDVWCQDDNADDDCYQKTRRPLMSFYKNENLLEDPLEIQSYQKDILLVVIFNLFRWLCRHSPIIASNRILYKQENSYTEVFSFVPGHLEPEEVIGNTHNIFSKKNTNNQSKKTTDSVENNTTECDIEKILREDQHQWLKKIILKCLKTNDKIIVSLLEVWNTMLYTSNIYSNVNGLTPKKKKRKRSSDQDDQDLDIKQLYQNISHIFKNNLYHVLTRCSECSTEEYGIFGIENSNFFTTWLIERGFMRLEPHIDIWLPPEKFGLK